MPSAGKTDSLKNGPLGGLRGGGVDAFFRRNTCGEGSSFCCGIETQQPVFRHMSVARVGESAWNVPYARPCRSSHARNGQAARPVMLCPRGAV